MYPAPPVTSVAIFPQSFPLVRMNSPSMHLERAAVRLGLKLWARGVLDDLVHLKGVRPRERVARERARLRVAAHELVGAHPGEEVLPAPPDGEDDVRVALVDGAQHEVRDEAGHLVHQPRALAEARLEGFAVLRLHVDAVGDRYHSASPLPEKYRAGASSLPGEDARAVG